MAGEKLKDSSPNEHEVVGMDNYNNADYATDNKYGQDLSGVSYKEGIEDHFGGDGSIGENDIKRMMDAGFSSDDVYNFSKKKGLNYNQHGQKYMKGQGSYEIGKGSDQWGDVFGEVNKPEGGIEPEVDGDPVVPETAPIDTGNGEVNMPIMPRPGGSPFGNTTQTVFQDNDQVSTVEGDNNTVNQDQDNSVQNFGGGYNAMDWKTSWMNSKFSA